MDYINTLLDGLPLGSYVLTQDSDGNLKPILVSADDQEWVAGEMPFTIPEYELAA